MVPALRILREERGTHGRGCVSEIKSSDGWGTRQFLFRSFVIGVVFCVPAAFFPQTRAVFRFLRDLEAVRMAVDLFHFVIVATLVGLIVQGVFHLVRAGLRSLSSSEKSGLS